MTSERTPARRAGPEAGRRRTVQAPTPAEPQIRVGVSSCLLGLEVRYDGGHKHDTLITAGLGRVLTFVPLCPEMGIGLGTPRETLRLVDDGSRVHMVTTQTARDFTDAMTAWSRDAMQAIAAQDLSGYILKKDSPSCGMERVKVHAPEGGMPRRTGVGLFAATLQKTFPLLPLEEEGRLRDARLRETFITRVFAYRRLVDFFAGAWKMRDLVEMHAREKYLLLAHSPPAYTSLGRLVGGGTKAMPRAALAAAYQREYMAAVARPATVARHHNVLQHMAGYFTRDIGEDERRELRGVLEDYRAGLVPLIVPITLIRHYARLLKVEWLNGQVYLDPHPKELALRNHV
jgi:uncharacterized protein YbgA (DUF1722 family)/uncharacterized protein YbbK (DUF523 family)